MVSTRTTRVGAAIVAGILASSTLLVAAPATAAPLDAVHDFEAGADGFFAYGPGTTSSVEGGEFCASVPTHTGNAWDIAVAHNAVALENGAEYTVRFSATSTADISIRAQVGINSGTYPTVHAEDLDVTSAETPYEYTFVANTDAAAEETGGQFSLQIGNQGEAFEFCMDDFSMTTATSAENLIPNGDFASGEVAPWFTGAGFGAADLSSGALCVNVPEGGSVYDGVGFNGLTIEAGTTYTLSYTASTTSPRTIRTLIGENGGSYRTVLEQNPAVTERPTEFSHTFTASTSFPAATADPAAGPYEGQLAFQIGDRGAAFTFCIDDVTLVESSTPPAAYEPETASRVRVNQVGYLPEGPKQATLVTESTEPVTWEVLSGGASVATGESTPKGVDPTARLNVHEIDFSSVTAPGSYTLVADGETSYGFEIDADLYQDLRYDALNWYYPMRSGIAIDGALLGDPKYTRPAGHASSGSVSGTVSGAASGAASPSGTVNQGDNGVPCLTEAEEIAAGGVWAYGDWTCDYTLDVVGGWYDAGDHGKYVVNGGIAASQVMGTYERELYSPTGDSDALADGTLDIPEADNGVPDVLDEARWELEWMMSMQVPEGAELAGMVHHKVHDVGWTGLPLLPSDDPQPRRLHRPSTAATLNFAADAAQGARLWAPYDASFAGDLLAAGQAAWDAALAHPDLYAPAEMGNNGGGAYNDDNVGDEFYWAAAELAITTGDQSFADYVVNSEYNANDIWDPTGFNWGSTAALGRLDLARVPSAIPGRETIRQSVIDAADGYLAAQQAHPFGSAYSGNADGGYDWGSNSMVLNNSAVLATAFDLTSDQKYADAVLESMDYLLGRNALNNSFITGYGDVFSKNQHNRWFASSLDPELPGPPVGSLSGGSNSTVSTWDPTIAGLYNADHMCAPQLCYVDNAQSWSTNEIAVNWNSALSFVASFVADQQAGDESDAGEVVRVTTSPADVTVTEGATVRFAASATGSESVQWQVLAGASGLASASAQWTDVVAATTGVLEFEASATQNGNRYRAVFTNEFGSATTDPATLTVNAAAEPAPSPVPTVPAPAPAPVPTVPVPTHTGSGDLAYTGADLSVAPFLVGGLLLAAGAFLLKRQARRRKLLCSN